jgi:AcrR family transcriptional regulator
MRGTSAGAPATERILDAAARRVVGAGAVETSLGDIAEAAGVSKALILYHFHDKDTLLARLVERVCAQLVARQRAILDGQPSAMAVESVWEWLEHELRLGTIRVLVELRHYRSPGVHSASVRAAADRRQAAGEMVGRLFTTLGLRPRVPAELLGEVTVAFEDGLALADKDGGQRVVFDVLWLALLNLAE